MKGEEGYSESNVTRPEWFAAKKAGLQQNTGMRDRYFIAFSP